jgi:phosphate transport system permease protein
MAIASVPDVRTTVRRRLTGHRVDVWGVVFQVMLLLSLLAALAILVTLLYEVIRTGLHVFSDRGSDFLTSSLSSTPERAGVWQGIKGSIGIAVFVVALAFPIGIGAAIYLEEYASRSRFAQFVNVNIRNLAGVPSVVYGLLGLAVFVKYLDGATGGRSLLSGGLTLAVLVLPIVIITTGEALRAVPDSLREAGFGVGATRWEVVRHHVLPYAAPGVLTGTVLALARALGEAAPLILVGAVFRGFFVSPGGVVDQLQGRFTALPMIVYGWASQPREEFREGLASAAILVLLVVILTANAAAILLRNRYERRR